MAETTSGEINHDDDFSNATAGQLVDLLDFMAQQGNPLVSYGIDYEEPTGEEDGSMTTVYRSPFRNWEWFDESAIDETEEEDIEYIQDYQYIDPITLVDYDVLVKSVRTMNGDGVSSATKEVELWVHQEQADITNWLHLSIDESSNYTYRLTEGSVITERQALELLVMLRHSTLLDDMKPEDLNARSIHTGLPAFWKRFPVVEV